MSEREATATGRSNRDGRLPALAEKLLARLAAAARMLHPVVLAARWRLCRSAPAGPDGRVPGAGSAAAARRECRRDALYQLWIRRHDRLTAADRAALRRHLQSLGDRPRFSILIPCRDADPAELDSTLASLHRQHWPHWEARLLTPPPEVPGTSKEKNGGPHETAGTSRVGPALVGCQGGGSWREKGGSSRVGSRVVEVGGTSRGALGRKSGAERGVVSEEVEAVEEVGDALAHVRGDWLMVVHPGDELSPLALYHLAAVLEGRPDAGLIYSDEDRLDGGGRRVAPRFKPDWNPELFASALYTGRLVVYRRELAAAGGGGLELEHPAEGELELLLRCVAAARPGTILHVREVLYHARRRWQERLDPARVRARLAAHLATAPRAASSPAPAVATGPLPATWRVRWLLPAEPPPVSLIVPTRNQRRLLERLLETLGSTAYPRYEVLVVDNGSDDPATLAYLEELTASGRARLLRFPGPFNYSALNNRAAGQAGGELLGFLNDDLEITAPEWLDEMVAQALRPDVGAVGARLLYPDGTVQHAGVLLGGGARRNAVAGHLFHRLERNDPGDGGRALLTQELSAVTSACLVMRRQVFDEVDGFDETRLPVAFNDVDLCLRLRASGYRIVWSASAELIHHGSASRGPDRTPAARTRFAAEVGYMRRRWGATLDRDPFYHPALDAERCDFSLAFPPRPEPPWRSRRPDPAGRAPG